MHPVIQSFFYNRSCLSEHSSVCLNFKIYWMWNPQFSVGQIICCSGPMLCDKFTDSNLYIKIKTNLTLVQQISSQIKKLCFLFLQIHSLKIPIKAGWSYWKIPLDLCAWPNLALPCFTFDRDLWYWRWSKHRPWNKKRVFEPNIKLRSLPPMYAGNVMFSCCLCVCLSVCGCLFSFLVQWCIWTISRSNLSIKAIGSKSVRCRS